MRSYVCYYSPPSPLHAINTHQEHNYNKMSTPKEKEVIFSVIELYRKLPCLWNKNHTDYKSKHKRTTANQMMLEVYRQIDESATMQMFIKKLLNLRTSYYKELHKVKKSQANNPDEGEIYEPTLWYYNALTFLGDNKSKCCHSNEKDLMEAKTISPSTSTSDGEGSYQNSEPHSSPPIKMRKFTNPIVYKNTIDRQTATVAVEPSHLKDEDCEIFGRAIGLQLRDLEDKQLTIVQKIISDAIYYAKFGLLSQQSYINLGTPPP